MKQNNSIFKWTTPLLFLLLSASSTFARVYYVDRDNRLGHGSHNNWPGTIEKPKSSLQHNWFQRDLEPGDTVILAGAASYSVIRFYGTSTGTADAPIVVMPYPGDKIISDASIIPGQHGVELLEGASYIHIYGLVVKGREYSYVTSGDNTGLKLIDSEIGNCQHGPRLNGVTDSEFRDLKIHDLGVNGFQLRGSLSASTGNPCRNILIKNVDVWNVNDNRTPDNSDADGFHSFGGEDITFINCTTWGNAEDGFDLNSNALLVNCMAYDQAACGLKAWRREGDDYAEKTITVINSIFANNGNHWKDTNPNVKVSMGAGLNMYNCVIANGHDQGLNIRVLLTGSDRDPILDMGLSYQPVRVYNTIFTSTQAGPAISDGGYLADQNMPLLEADYNLYYDNQSTNEGYTLGEHSITGLDPMFADTANLDFNLLSNSPAIDKGYDLSSIDDAYVLFGLEDIAGNARPTGQGFDMGPYEFTGSSFITAMADIADGSLTGSSVRLYPVPMKDHLNVEVEDPHAEVAIYNMAGIKMKQSQTLSGGIDVSQLPSGRYVVKVLSNQKTLSYHVFKN